jgi:hypothetical protein
MEDSYKYGNYSDPNNSENFLNSYRTGSFSNTTMLFGEDNRKI